MIFFLPRLKGVSGLEAGLFFGFIDEEPVEKFMHDGGFLIGVEGQDVGVTNIIESRDDVQGSRVFVVSEKRNGFSLSSHVGAIARVDQHLVIHRHFGGEGSLFGDWVRCRLVSARVGCGI